jgi:hypothetical protein
MNHLQNHIDNYLVHCQTQKRLDAKTLKAYLPPFEAIFESKLPLF